MNNPDSIRQKWSLGKIPIRYVVVSGTFFLSGLLYIDRVCISVAKDPIIRDLHLSEKQMGWILSVFSLGYAMFQVPGGMLMDKFGPRKILSLVVSLWSLFTALTGIAWNFLSLTIVRFLFGVGESGAFPGIARAFYSWIPMTERGRMTGVNFSGSRIGSAIALPILAWMIHKYGWSTSFFVLGATGIIWAFIWYSFFRNDPTSHPLITEEEKKFILENRQGKTETSTSISAGQIFHSRNMRWMVIQYFANNYTFFFVMTWLFPYLREKFHLNSVETGLFVALPLLTGAVGNWIAGAWVDSIFKKNQWARSRRIPAMTGFFLAAVGLLIGAHAQNVWLAIIFLSISICGEDMTLSSSWSTCTDIGQKNSGTVSATMNMVGNFGAFVTSLAFPYLKSWSGSDLPFFYVGVALNLIAVYCWTKIDPRTPI